MYIIKYETNLKEYILYDINQEYVEHLLYSNNGLYQFYPDDKNIQIRLYFKIDLFVLTDEEQSIEFKLEEIYKYINYSFNSTNDDWIRYTSIKKIKEYKKYSMYFFSKKYSIVLKNLRILIDKLYIYSYYFDISIYYSNNRFKIISLPLANQSDLKYKYSNVYTLSCGEMSSSFIMNIDSLSILVPMV